jgi:23S rRNA (cytidine1920-2'-O)/16S rRNA (cytidine1409-2'-O)-methyltransferase
VKFRERIDKLLVIRGFADSTKRAAAMVMAGVILVDEQRVEKASQTFSPNSNIRIKGDRTESKYVGRGGLKLEEALNSFAISVSDLICLDVGSSTGGFSDCLLQNGARKVVAIDAGTNQLAWSLRNDPRMDVRENTNARYLKPEDFDKSFDLIVIDVSFISVAKIIPALMSLLNETGKVIVLIKPQFEAAKFEVGTGGIITDLALHERIVREINSFAEECGLRVGGVIESPILGAKGNKEFLALYEK